MSDIYTSSKKHESRYRRRPGLGKPGIPRRPAQELHGNLWIGIILLIFTILIVLIFTIWKGRSVSPPRSAALEGVSHPQGMNAGVKELRDTQ